jgi:chemotaxis protein CheC
VTNLRPPLPQHEIDRLCELAALGASAAGHALGAMIALPIEHRAPRILGPGDPSPADRWNTGILIEADGDLSGIVAIALPDSGRERAVEQMLGRSDAAAELVESALRELGNILASHMVSAMADTLDATVLHSVPQLEMRDVGAKLAALVDERSAPLRIESDLVGQGGEVAATLVYAPEPWKPSAS